MFSNQQFRCKRTSSSNRQLARPMAIVLLDSERAKDSGGRRDMPFPGHVPSADKSSALRLGRAASSDAPRTRNPGACAHGISVIASGLWKTYWGSLRHRASTRPAAKCRRPTHRATPRPRNTSGGPCALSCRWGRNRTLSSLRLQSESPASCRRGWRADSYPEIS
jgi:hypothetical protein